RIEPDATGYVRPVNTFVAKIEIPTIVASAESLERNRVRKCEIGAVKVRVHRAMRELRSIFSELSARKQHVM
ncbi:MAG TPA: hypothetical protein VM260_11075, partial [Pirellula sp.]|nr:hypothetical protein [Pirellula sp.]